MIRHVTRSSTVWTTIIAACVISFSVYIGAQFRKVDEAAIMRNRATSAETNRIVTLIEGRQASAIAVLDSLRKQQQAAVALVNANKERHEKEIAALERIERKLDKLLQ